MVNVAIDGFAGSGKTTVALELAERLDLVYLDTGLMYRAVALYCFRSGVNCNDPEAVAGLLGQIPLQVEVNPQLKPSCRMLLGEEDVTDLLHDPQIGARVSQVAAISPVRRDLVARQQAFARRGGVVMVGRDIASVVLPQAEIKLFLSADLEERARRRTLELQAQGKSVTLAEVETELRQRDSLDTQREDSPLLEVPGAVRLDTTHLTLEQVVAKVEELVRCGSL